MIQLGNCVEIGLPMLILLVISQLVNINDQDRNVPDEHSSFINLTKIHVCLLQYLKRIHHSRAHQILERLALLFCIGIIWAFASILTVVGAYNNVKTTTKQSCHTDRSLLISSAPWYDYDLLHSLFDCAMIESH